MGLQQGSAITCPLCLTVGAKPYAEDQTRRYLRCLRCRLVFVTSDQHLSPEAEKAIYDHHQNSPDDHNYRKFLSRLTKPLTKLIAPQSQGLDFGCGPGPTLSVMMAEQGYQMSVYDLYYADDPQVLKGQYDFITSTEVVEHLASPRQELNNLPSRSQSLGRPMVFASMQSPQASSSLNKVLERAKIQHSPPQLKLGHH